MTKPVTAVAAMILVEEGIMRLDDPVDRWLPELAAPRVLVRPDASLDETVPAARPITVRDCLTFRTGHVAGIGSNPTPLEAAIVQAQLFGLKPATPHEPDEWVRRLALLPLAYQPGEQWTYHAGSDLLGVLIARASGMSLDALMRSRIFRPLGMKNTGFAVPADKLDRLTSCYVADPHTKQLEILDAADDAQWGRPTLFQSGGGGLVATLDDYLAFARMMLGGGRSGTVRILSRPAVAAMTADQLSAQQRRTAGWSPMPWPGRGWGLGIGVVRERTGPAMTPGAFGWDGAFGTLWSADPVEDMTVLVMTQCAAGPGAGIGPDILTLAYAAIDD
jgi:CubicO group peptidase (beta-lactamase class C family)